MDPLLITNLTEATQVDGVYVLDVPPPGFVQGAGTGIVGIVGDFEMGPTDEVVSIGSTAEFTRIFGGYGAAPSAFVGTWRGYSGYRAVAGKRWPAGLRVVRPSRTGAARATYPLGLVDGTDETSRLLTLTAAHPGDYGNQLKITVEDATDASVTDGVRLTITLGTRSQTIDNIDPDWTAAELTAAMAAAGVDLVTAAISVPASSTRPSLPFTSSFASGADGTPDATKWTGGIDKLLSRREVKILFAAEPDGTTVTAAALNTHIKSVIPNRLAMAVLHGASALDADDAATAAGSVRSDRIVLAWPWRKQYFAEAVNTHKDGILTVPANDVVACALANLDPVYDPSSRFGTVFINAATSGLEFDNLDRDDYVTANRGGVCALEFDPDLGYRVVNGITTSLIPGTEMIHRARLRDYFIESIAYFLKFYQGQPITRAWKEEIRGAVTAFLKTEQDLQPVPRVITFEVDTASVNDSVTEAQGIYNIRTLIRTPASARFVVLMAQVGTTVTVSSNENTLQ